MKWAFSVLAYKIEGNVCHSRHCTGMVEATSRDEAVGKALRIGKKVYPEYYHYDVVTESEYAIIDPDNFDPSSYKPT